MSNRSRILAALALCVAAVAALESLLLPVLPLVQHEFGVSAATGALAPVALTLTTVVVTPLAGRFADTHGARRTLLGIAVLVVAGALLSAYAGRFPLFVAGQVLQGAGLGLLPVSFVVLRELFPAARIQAATGLLMSMTVVGSAVGVLAAGPIAENLGRTPLYAVPAVLLCAGAALFAVSGPAPRREDRPRPDLAGASLLSLALVALAGWISVSSSAGPFSPAALALCAITAALWSLWVFAERRVRQPMIEIGMLAARPIRSALLTGIAMGWAYGTIVYLIPQELTVRYGYGSTTTGFFLAYAFGIAIGTAPLFGRYAARLNLALTGQVLLVAGCLVCCLPGVAPILAGLTLLGLGAAATSTAIFAVAATAVREQQVGVATALVTIARALGAALGTQVAAGLIASGSPGSFRMAFVIGAVAALAGGVPAVGSRLASSRPAGPHVSARCGRRR